MIDTPMAAGAPAYRGFLFSDIRGFTAFGERYGNAAAADAVAAFLDIARTAISRHAGAEIKTEGDAIHAVFPSASSAVLCGLDIVDGAGQLNAKHPERRIGIGVGVHAGEAVETAEGYIGRAVNIAARLCAQARPGEVLVSSTVKGITQASIPVGFVARGKRRLKGINEPILVYSVTRDPSAKASRLAPRHALIGAAGVAALAIAALIAAQLLPGFGGGRLPSASPTPAARPLLIGSLPIGSYVSTAFVPAVRFTVGDPGWATSRDLTSMLALVRETAPRGNIFFLRVASVIESPCIAGGEGGATAPTSVDLLTKLGELTHLTVTNRERVQVGHYAGQQVDIAVDPGALAACAGLIDSGVPLFDANGEIWSATPGEQFRLVSVDVEDKPVTVLMSADWTTTPSVQSIESLLQFAQRILDTVEF